MAQRYAAIVGPWRLERLRGAPRVGNLPLLAGLALAAAALLSLLYLAETSGVAITGYDVQQLEAQRDDWQRRNDQLQLQIAEARSLGRIEREARRLGLEPARSVVYVAAPAARPAAIPRAPGGLGATLEAARAAVAGAVGWLSGEL